MDQTRMTTQQTETRGRPKRAAGIIQRVLGSALFLAILAFSLIHITYLLRPDDYGNYRWVFPEFYSMEKNSLDMICIGNSAAYRFINNPWIWENTGITSYNLSVGAMPMASYPYIIEEAEKTQSPELFIIEVRDALVEYNADDRLIYAHRVTDGMNFSLVRDQTVRTLVPMQDFLNTEFDLLMYHDNWENLTADQLAYIDNKEKLPMMGWDDVFRIEPMERPSSYEDVTWRGELDPEKEKALTRLLEYCRDHEVPVLFMESPCTLTREQAAMNNTIADRIAEYGFPFLNLNHYYDEIGLDFDTDYYNSCHVNSWGARKVTSFLISYLKEHYTFDTKHSSAVSKEWAEASAYEIYRLEKATAKRDAES